MKKLTKMAKSNNKINRQNCLRFVKYVLLPFDWFIRHFLIYAIYILTFPISEMVLLLFDKVISIFFFLILIKKFFKLLKQTRSTDNFVSWFEEKKPKVEQKQQSKAASKKSTKATNEQKMELKVKEIQSCLRLTIFFGKYILLPFDWFIRHFLLYAIYAMTFPLSEMILLIIDKARQFLFVSLTFLNYQIIRPVQQTILCHGLNKTRSQRKWRRSKQELKKGFYCFFLF